MKPLRIQRKKPGQPSFVIGVDFGTLSARAVVVDARNGEEMGAAVSEYRHGVVEDQLPGTGVPLKESSALQHPGDYLEAPAAAVRKAVRRAGVRKEDVIGIATDFTSCTVLPVDERGDPLCLRKHSRRNPHAWVKLWKHHATQPEADRINEVGRRQGEGFIRAYGGKYSSEWFFSKVLETVREAPEVYRAADGFLEAGDWIVWQLCGEPSRNVSAAGFKGMRVEARGKEWGYPGREFFRELHPAMERVVEEKLKGEVVPLGSRVGGLTADMAARLGLCEGVAVAAGNIDAHAAVPACGVAEAGDLVMIMGTSTCHLLLGKSREEVEGMCGVVEDGIIAGLWGYEAGQPGVGDLFAWYAEEGVPGYVAQEAMRAKASVHEWLSQKAAGLRPGESGLLALDWWNGNRSVLVDADLSGVLMGMTLRTEPHEIYRALIEATAFGTRKIVEAFSRRDLPIETIYACGGLAHRNPLVLQIYADVLQRPIRLVPIEQASAFGAAMHGAVAAGFHEDIRRAVRRMAPKARRVFRPVAKHGAVYDEMYKVYSKCHDQFGRDLDSPLKKLRRIREGARQA